MIVTLNINEEDTNKTNNDSIFIIDILMLNGSRNEQIIMNSF